MPSNATPNNAKAVELGSGTVPEPLGPPLLLLVVLGMFAEYNEPSLQLLLGGSVQPVWAMNRICK